MNALNIIFFVLLLVCLLVYSLLARQRKAYCRLILFYLLLITLVSVVAMALMNAGVQNNLFLFHIYTPIEYALLSLLYVNVFIDRRTQQVIRYSIPIFFVISILSSLFVQGIRENNSYVTILESLLILCWSLFFLREVMLLQQVTALHRYPMFWICVGILFYFTGTLITEGMMNYLINHSLDLAQRLYSFTYIFKFVLFILLLVGAAFDLYASSRHHSSKTLL